MVVNIQVDIPVRQDFLIRVLLRLVPPDLFLSDSEEQQSPAEDLTHRRLRVLPQEPPAVVLDAPERIPPPLLLPAGAGVEDEQLRYPDDAGEAAIVVSRLLPCPGVRLHAEHGAEAQQRGAVPPTSIPVADQRHGERGHGVT